MVAHWIRLFCVCSLSALVALAGAPALAGPIKFQANGLAAAGPQALLALDFVDGNAAPNSLTAGSFTSDGALALQSQTGAVSGTLASGLLWQDSGFLNEALLALTGAGSFSFVLNATSVAPVAGGFADAFSIFLLDTSTGLSLVDTDDPTGNNALLLFLIDGTGAGQLQVFGQTSGLALGWNAAPVGGGGGTVPEPASWALVLLAILGWGVLRSRNLLRCRAASLPTVLATLLVAGFGMAQAADTAVGRVSLMIGEARVVRLDGSRELLRRGAAIQVGDRVETTANGHVHLLVRQEELPTTRSQTDPERRPHSIDRQVAEQHVVHEWNKDFFGHGSSLLHGKAADQGCLPAILPFERSSLSSSSRRRVCSNGSRISRS